MKLQKWLSPPTTGDEDKDSLARALYTIQLALLAVFIFSIILLTTTARFSQAIIVLFAGLPLFLEIWLIRVGHVRTSGFMVLATLLGLAIFLLYIGDGLIDVAILLFPAVIIVSSLLFTKRIFLLMTGFSLISLTWIALEQYFGHVASRGKTPLELFGDWVIVMMILPITALTSYILAENMRKNLRQAREDKSRLTTANRNLEIEVVERKHAEAEREKLIHELEAKNAELERFTYTVSHDLKSPLITIRGFLGFLERDAKAEDHERMQADLERISDATDKMQRLLGELLELSRIGRMMNPPVEVPFGEIVKEAIALVYGQIEARGVEVWIAPDLPLVRGDRARLVEVVQNLLDNAVKFMGGQSHPRIDIGTRGMDEAGNPILYVRDNGIGIKPEYHEKVFGLFNKLDPHTEGTGVGLALVRRIIDVHGGKIWVESEGTGKGTVFFFTLGARDE